MSAFTSCNVGRWFACLAAALSLWSMAGGAHGQVIDWIAPGGGSYVSTLNWSGFNVPNTTTEHPRFNLNSIYNVTFGAGSSTTVGDLLVTRGEVTFASSGAVLATFNIDDDAFVDGGNLLLSQSAGPGNVNLNVSDQLIVRGGSSFFAGDGADVTAGSIQAATTTGSATIVITGTGSTLNAGNSMFGMAGNTATLTVADGAEATLGAITLGDDAGSNGTFNVEGGAKVTSGNLTLGRTGSQTVGTLTISGAETEFTQTGNFINIGTSGSNSLNSVLSLTDGTFNTGTSTTTVRFNGVVNISGGTYNANGNIHISAGRLIHSGGQFNLAAAKNLISSSSQSQISFASSQTLNANNYTIEGGSLSFGASVTLGGADGDGTMTIDGPSAMLSVGGDAIIGDGIFNAPETDGAMTLRNHASGAIGGNLLVGTGGSNLDDFTGTLTVESHASLTVAGQFLVGSSNPTVGIVNILSGGVLNAETTSLHPGSAIHITDASADLGVLNQFSQSGALNFNSGSLRFEGDLSVGPLGLLGTNLSLSSTRKLALSGTTTIDPQSTLTLDGGTLETGALVNDDGTFDFIKGTLRITGAPGLTIGAEGPLGDRLELKPAAILDVTQGIVNEGIVTGDGTLVGPFTNAASGEVRAQSGNTLFFAGAAHTSSGTVRLLGGWAEFGGTLANAADGNITGRGTLSTGGLTNQGDLALSGGVSDVFGDVTNEGAGRVIVSGHADVTFWDDVTHTGAQFNVSTGSSATFFGTAGFGVSGGGDVFFEADVTPGASPGLEQFGGNVFFGPLANLEIELAGTARGSQYDVLEIAGTATLDGTLDVSLLSFAPDAGDTFEIIAAGDGVTGTFASELLPALTGDLFWNVVYGANSVMLEVAAPGLPGDYNVDGSVDAADYVVWRKNGGAPDGYGTWRANFGRTAATAGSAASAAVPEPSGMLLSLGLAGLLLASCRRPAVAPQAFSGCSQPVRDG